MPGSFTSHDCVAPSGRRLLLGSSSRQRALRALAWGYAWSCPAGTSRFAASITYPYGEHSVLGKDEQPKEILDKCRAMDAEYVYEETMEIRTEADIANLSCAFGGFHDAFIAREELMEDGTLYLLFDGTWGCKIEVWFRGDLEYDTSSRHSDEYDHFWFGSTVILQDGFVYLIDDDGMTVNNIGPGYCYFKARHMKYRIIPD